MSIYLDNAATTAVLPEASAVACDTMTNLYANPASLHTFGFEAEKLLEKSRETLAKAVGCKSEELFFTSGGTGSDNLAVLGYLKTKRGGRIITSAYEHPAVLECFKQAESKFDVVYLKPENGIITEEALQRELTPDTVLVSVMHVNNETGALNPTENLAGLTHLVKGAVFHTDAVQAFMKEPFDYSKVDMASFSAHKTHAPKGIGAIYIKKGIKIKPVLFGGGQEKGLFSGTSNVAGAAAWATAVERTDVKANREKVAQIFSLLKEKVEVLGGLVISPENGSPYILNAVFEGYMAENLLHYLSNEGIYVSTGSACSSKHGSHVFKALGLEKYQKNALRFSFSQFTTEEEINKTADTLKDALGKIIKKS